MNPERVKQETQILEAHINEASKCVAELKVMANNLASSSSVWQLPDVRKTQVDKLLEIEEKVSELMEHVWHIKSIQFALDKHYGRISE